MSRADLTGAILIGADMRGTVMEGVIFCRTTMPDKTINNGNCPR